MQKDCSMLKCQHHLKPKAVASLDVVVPCPQPGRAGAFLIDGNPGLLVPTCHTGSPSPTATATLRQQAANCVGLVFDLLFLPFLADPADAMGMTLAVH
jgi:hypothetical protein